LQDIYPWGKPSSVSDIGRRECSDYYNMPRGGIAGTNRPEHAKAVHAWHIKVSNQDVGMHLSNHDQPLKTVSCRKYLHTGIGAGNRDAQEAKQIWVVFDQNHTQLCLAFAGLFYLLSFGKYLLYRAQ
jgi:hypothetical protein